MKNNYFPPQFVILGYLLIGLGIYFIIMNDWVGYIMIPGGMVFSFLMINHKINLENKKYREYFILFGLKFGKWKDIPDIEYITVYPERTSQGKNVASISSSHTEDNIRVDLIISRTERVNAAKYHDTDSAIKNGRELAKSFDCKLLDYTSGKAEWVDF